MRSALALVLVSALLAASGCAAYRSQGVFVTGYRIANLPADWRQAPIALFEVRDPDPVLSRATYEPSSRSEDQPVEDALRSAGFLGGRIQDPSGLVVLWRVDRRVLSSRPRVPAEVGLPVQPPLLAATPTQPLSSTAVEAAREGDRPPVDATSGLETYSLEISIVDLRQTGIPEVFRGRCVLRAPDRRLVEAAGFAARRIFEGFPEVGSVQFDQEVGTLTVR